MLEILVKILEIKEYSLIVSCVNKGLIFYSNLLFPLVAKSQIYINDAQKLNPEMKCDLLFVSRKDFAQMVKSNISMKNSKKIIVCDSEAKDVVNFSNLNNKPDCLVFFLDNELNKLN
jgi:hypothetical protein